MHHVEIVLGHRVNEHINEDDTLYKIEVDPTLVKRSDVLHFADNFIDNDDEQLSSHQSKSIDDE